MTCTIFSSLCVALGTTTADADRSTQTTVEFIMVEIASQHVVCTLATCVALVAKGVVIQCFDRFLIIA